MLRCNKCASCYTRRKFNKSQYYVKNYKHYMLGKQEECMRTTYFSKIFLLILPRLNFSQTLMNQIPQKLPISLRFRLLVTVLLNPFSIICFHKNFRRQFAAFLIGSATRGSFRAANILLPAKKGLSIPHAVAVSTNAGRSGSSLSNC